MGGLTQFAQLSAVGAENLAHHHHHVARLTALQPAQAVEPGGLCLQFLRRLGEEVYTTGCRKNCQYSPQLRRARPAGVP